MRSIDAYEAQLFDEALRGFEEVDEAYTFRAVEWGNPRPNRPQGLRVGPAVTEQEAIALLRNRQLGVWLEGATRAEAEAWARSVGARAPVFDHQNAHSGGSLPHYHAVFSGNDRSGHIFYGRAPTRDFFDR